jgi:hypothetical protein
VIQKGRVSPEPFRYGQPGPDLRVACPSPAGPGGCLLAGRTRPVRVIIGR